MRLVAHGIAAELPPGWEGRISLRAPDAAAVRASAAAVDARVAVAATATGQALLAPPPPRSLPLAHLATFGLPVDRGDHGSGAVETMGAEDAFVALLEFGPESVGTALFPRDGLPRTLSPSWFSGRALQRTIPGQGGFQRFFTHAERAFSLYVVLGSQQRAVRVVPRVNHLLQGLEVTRR